MNDDVKAAVEKLTTWLGEDGGLPVLRVVLAHIDSEDARTAAAVAAAREEQREACYRAMTHPGGAGSLDAGFVQRRLAEHAPLTATPLADELRDEREVSQSLREQLIAAEAERDALRAQTSLTDGPCVECGESTQWAAGDPGRWSVMLPTEAEPGVAKHHHVKCVLGWRAQVEAARAVAAMFKECDLGFYGARAVIAAMDGAKLK